MKPKLKAIKSLHNAKPGQFVVLTRPVKAYKAAYDNMCGDNDGRLLVTLEIPKGAIVFTGEPGNDKLRANFALVEKINVIKEEYDGPWDIKYSASKRTRKVAYSGIITRATDESTQVTYRPGLLVAPRGKEFSFDATQYAPGIHFFLSRKAALEHTG